MFYRIIQFTCFQLQLDGALFSLYCLSQQYLKLGWLGSSWIALDYRTLLKNNTISRLATLSRYCVTCISGFSGKLIVTLAVLWPVKRVSIQLPGPRTALLGPGHALHTRDLTGTCFPPVCINQLASFGVQFVCFTCFIREMGYHVC